MGIHTGNQKMKKDNTSVEKMFVAEKVDKLAKEIVAKAYENKPKLGAEKKKRLEKYETAIREYVESAFVVGASLRNIKSEKLHLEFSSFDDYCAEKWGMDDSH